MDSSRIQSNISPVEIINYERRNLKFDEPYNNYGQSSAIKKLALESGSKGSFNYDESSAIFDEYVMESHKFENSENTKLKDSSSSDKVSI